MLDAQQSVLRCLLWRTNSCGYATPMSNVLLLRMEKFLDFSCKIFSARDSRMGVFGLFSVVGDWAAGFASLLPQTDLVYPLVALL